jgi:RimJ/RimL family protein N-acetyltransferase
MIQLQKFEEKDFPTFKSWIRDENQLFQFAGSIFSFPIEDHQLLTYINDNKRIAFKVVLISSNETIGHCELNFENNLPRLSRILIGKEELRNQGYGKLIVNEMLKLIFNTYGFEQVDLNVFDWNVGAIKCYERIGFKFTEVVGKEYQLEDAVWKSRNMILTKSDWKQE